jgi:AcrR family transcriptional regulator
LFRRRGCEHTFVTHPTYLREKARTLRIERSLTIDEIAERLALPRTTIFYWVRDLPIARRPPVIASRAQALGNRAMQAKYRLARKAAYAEGRATFASLATDPTFRDFVCLYLTEGSKRSWNRVQVCNSDPAVVKLCDQWLRRLSSKRRTYAIQYHADQELVALRAFWAEALGIDGSAIRLQRKSNSNQLAGRTWRSEYGVLGVTVNDILLRARLSAWMDSLRDAWP